MRISPLVAILALCLSLALLPSSIHASTVSGEAKIPVKSPVVTTPPPKVTPDSRKTVLLEKKIKQLERDLARQTLAINTLEERLASAKMTKIARNMAEKNLKTLKSQKLRLESSLASLKREKPLHGN